MKSWEKEILQNQMDNEEAILKKLRGRYRGAIDEIKDKIEVLKAKEQTQSVIYQIKYQEQLKKEITQVYSKMYKNMYSDVDSYLKDCYTDSFLGTMYGLHKQDIPLIFPMDQEAAAQMAGKTSDGIKLSKKLYKNQPKMVNAVRDEITKGIAMNSSYADIARNVSKKSEASVSQSYRIARTEGHRIQNEVNYKTLNQAKEAGADVVKQWDASIDKRTRPHHAQLDGQIRELDEPFEIAGRQAQYPGGFGVASEDINCRCAVLQRARWALDEDELKTLQERAKAFGLDKSKDFEDFKKKYIEAETVEKAKLKFQKEVKKASNTDDILTTAKRFDNVYEADGYHRSHNFNQDQWDNGFSENERTGVYKYTGIDYKYMNRHLRKGEDVPQYIKDYISWATDALEKTSIKEDVVVHRGMGDQRDVAFFLGVNSKDLTNEAVRKSLIGTRHVDKAFVSTSITEHGAWSGCKLEIYVPKGSKGMYVDPISRYQGEYEVLLQRNSIFEIKSIEADEYGDISKMVLVLVEQNL